VHLRPEDKGCVLVVEDEALVRLVAVDMILEAGYRVLEADNADEAIRILDARNDICFIFTDIDMPGSIDGLKLAHAVSKRWPPIRIIVTSGMQTPKESELPKGSRFLPKPYDAGSLGTAFSQLAA
jgi:CheY-like chemotaxis protein